MADTDAEKALLIAAETFLEANGFTGKISWENDGFDPSGKTQWASVFFVPNDPEPVTLGVQGSDRQTGFLQIDVNVPQNTGSAAMRDWQNAGRAEFVAGKSYRLDDVVVVSGGGVEAVNGNYLLDGEESGKDRFTLEGGVTGSDSVEYRAEGRWGIYSTSGSPLLKYLSEGNDFDNPADSDNWDTPTSAALPSPDVTLPPTVVIVSAGWTAGRNVDNWFRKSLTVAFRADFTRTAI